VTTVVALGGNALLRRGERGTAAEQRSNLRETCAALEPVLGGEVVVTHGNGPQVGNELLRHERAAADAPPLPLWMAVAQTQAEIGTLLESELSPIAGRPVTCVLTHVRVDADDPAFAEPAKPIGPFYAEATARELERERGWQVVSDAGRGWRRVVPSPQPRQVVELDAVKALLAAGTIAIACGGGGIPVVERDGRLLGTDAVIDKDRVSALLAIALEAERMLVVTQVSAVYRAFGSAEQEEVRELTADDAEALLPELPPGSMRPKLEACAAYVRATGGTAIVTSANALREALAGRAGTRVSP
jgi:carbamate kinase